MPLEVLKVLDHMTGKGMIVEPPLVPARIWGVLPSQQIHLMKERPDVPSPHPHRDVPGAHDSASAADGFWSGSNRAACHSLL
jgi:hypothetical protein